MILDYVPWLFLRFDIVSYSIYICAFRELRITEFVLVNLVFMDGASLHVGTFRKEKWYFICTAVSVSVHFLKHLSRLVLKLHFHQENHYYV